MFKKRIGVLGNRKAISIMQRMLPPCVMAHTQSSQSVKQLLVIDSRTKPGTIYFRVLGAYKLEYPEMSVTSYRLSETTLKGGWDDNLTRTFGLFMPYDQHHDDC